VKLYAISNSQTNKPFLEVLYSKSLGIAIEEADGYWFFETKEEAEKVVNQWVVEHNSGPQVIGEFEVKLTSKTEYVGKVEEEEDV